MSKEWDGSSRGLNDGDVVRQLLQLRWLSRAWKLAHTQGEGRQVCMEEPSGASQKGVLGLLELRLGVGEGREDWHCGACEARGEGGVVHGMCAGKRWPWWFAGCLCSGGLTERPIGLHMGHGWVQACG